MGTDGGGTRHLLGVDRPAHAPSAPHTASGSDPTPVTPRAKRRAIIAASVCAVAIVTIVVLGVVLSKNVVYFRTVSEAVEQRPSEGDNRLRVAGEVVPGTIAETRRGVRFEVTDGKATIPVVHRGDPPGLFKDGAPVVCEGNWSQGETFDSDRILIKHGNEYKPPDVDSEKSEKATS
jgi:cytochrome c-type biogenesis protein CcmE